MRASVGTIAILAALHAILFVAVFPPWGAWFLTPVVALPLVIAGEMLGRDAKLQSTWGRVLSLACVFLVSALMWGWISRWTSDVSEAGWPALSLYLGTFNTIFVWLLGRLRRGRLARWPLALVAGVLWGGVEFLRGGVLFTGYPWYLLAHPLIDAPMLAQGAAIAGVGPLSALLAATAGAIVAIGRAPRRWAGLAVVLLLWGALAAYGALSLAAPLRPGPVIAAVQTNLLINNKIGWNSTSQRHDFPEFLAIAASGAEEARRLGIHVDLFALPETMMPGFGLEPEVVRLQTSMQLYPGDIFTRPLRALQAQLGSPFLIGSPSFDGLRPGDNRWEWDRQFNSAYLLDGEKALVRYDKLLLTPFGETMPYISASKWLEQRLLDLGAHGMAFDLSPGDGPVLFEIPWGAAGDQRVAFATPICFEDTVSRLCRAISRGDGVRRAQLLVNLSNDAWFGDDDAGREAHLLGARWRCIELRVPLVRVANTGISACVDSNGRVISSLPPRRAECLLARTLLDDRVSLYSRIGEVGSWLLLAGTLAMLIDSWIRRRPRPAGVTPGATAALLAAAATLITGCGPKNTSVTPASGTYTQKPQNPSGASSILGMDTPPSQQEWSTRDRSVTPAGAGEPVLNVDRPAKRVTPSIAVAHSGDTRRAAIELLQAASKSDWDLLRAHSLELLENDPAILEPLARKALVDPNRCVRFVAAMSIGKCRLDSSAMLVQPLLMDPSPSVQAAAIYALARNGRAVDLSPLAVMLRSNDPETRGNALLVLGELGNPSAIPMIRASVGTGMNRVSDEVRKITDLQAAEAMAKLGDDSALEPIRAGLFAPDTQSEIIALSCQMLGRLKDGGSTAGLQVVAGSNERAARPPEIRLLALTALAQIGRGNEADPANAVIYAQNRLRDPSPRIRSTAVQTLATAGGIATRPQLEGMLYDADPRVQVAAAGAILQVTAGGEMAGGGR